MEGIGHVTESTSVSATDHVARNVLIYSHVPLWEAHHAEAIELAWHHNDLGDHVHFISCGGALASCPANPFHKRSLCVACRLQTRRTTGDLLPPNTDHSWLDSTPEPRFDLRDDQQLFDFRVGAAPLGELVLSQLIDEFNDGAVAPSTIRGRGNRLLANSVALYWNMRELISKANIDLVYAWNGRRPSDGPVLWAATDEHVGYAAFISGGKRDRMLVLPAQRIHDLRAVLKEQTREIEAAHARLGQAEVRRRGAKYFAEMQSSTLDQIGAIKFVEEGFASFELADPPAGKRRLVFFTSSSHEFAYMRDQSTEVAEFSDQFEVITRLANDAALLDAFEIVIRWHPNMRNTGPNDRALLSDCVSRASAAIHFLPESSADSHRLIEVADIVVTVGSTMGVEAASRGVASVVLGKAQYMERGCVYLPRSWKEFVELAVSGPPPLPREGALDYGYYAREFGNHYLRHVQVEQGSKSYVAHRRVQSRLSRIVLRCRRATMLVSSRLLSS